MALELRQSLSLTQQLIMTPQLQQAIKLLQLSRLELLDTIQQELEGNPVLEEQLSSDSDEDGSPEEKRERPEGGDSAVKEVKVEENTRDDVDWENYLNEYNTAWTEAPHEVRELPPLENITASKTNLSSHLLWQLNMSRADEITKEIGYHIIGNLNDDGYLTASLEEIAAASGYSFEQVQETLEVIQNFDPVGIAARDTRECLLIQVAFHDLGGTIVEEIIKNHMGALEDRRYERLAKDLSIPLQEVLSDISVIQRLEPKPGRTFTDEETIYVSPDIYVFKVGDDYEITLNEDGLPKLRVNTYYKDVLSGKDSLPDNAKNYIQEKLKSAAWLIRSIHQRQRTIYRVTESIVRFQRDFLENGITHLRPLVLRDVAEDIEMHESTISRVTTNKFAYTPQGLFELKFFFNSAINTIEGDAVASESVKEHIRNIVKREDAAKPYSDQEISNILKKLNIRVARRTVAKYRESMGILPSRRRRQPY
ncbi:MAG: RNA polymerase factor sigma-54 [Deltaproteobacteria bacterium]